MRACNINQVHEEVNWKANLNWIAVNLDKIEDYNIIGCSPQEIFCTHIEVLRAFNYAGGIECIISLYDREVLNNLYVAFHNYIRGKRMNKYQVLYLKDIYYSGEKLNKKMYEFLGKLWNDSQYYAYLRYREYKQVVDDYYSILPNCLIRKVNRISSYLHLTNSLIAIVFIFYLKNDTHP